MLSNLCGVDTHGVFHLPRYVNEIREGLLVPTAWPEILSETPTTALISGNWTFGHVVAKYAMEVAVAKARDQNVATVSLVRAMHIGRVGEYAEMAVANGMVALVWGLRLRSRGARRRSVRRPGAAPAHQPDRDWRPPPATRPRWSWTSQPPRSPGPRSGSRR